MKTWLLLSFLTIWVGSALTPFAAFIPGKALQDEAWTIPVNLSRSGAASNPRIVSAPDGRLQAFWWDSFDGLTTAVFDGQTWSGPSNAPIQSDGLAQTPHVMIDPSGWVHAFWTQAAASNTISGGSAMSLMHSQMRFGSTEWTFPEVLAESALNYDISTSASGGLNLVYIRALHTPEAPAGVYVKRNSGGGEAWGVPQAVYTSIYTRLMTSDQAYVTVNETNGTLDVIWMEHRQGEFLFSVSNDGGLSWSEPETIAAREEPLEQPRLASILNGAAFLIWQEVLQGTCTLYQKELPDGSLLDTDASAPDSKTILSGLSACPQNDRFLPLSDGILWLWGESSPNLSLVAWQPGVGQWSFPLNLNFTFEDTEAQQPVELSDLHAAVTREQFAVVGVDQTFNDVWVTQTQVSTLEIAYAAPADWHDPQAIFSNPVEMHSTVFATDEDQRLHIFWSQISDASTKKPRNDIYHTSWDGRIWSRPAAVLHSPEGNADQPAVSLHPDERLLIVWRGGQPTEIYFSWANTSQANRSLEWSPPQMLPSPESGASSPSILVDSTGKISVVYAIPLNEGRGVYLTQSSDRGVTWSRPVQVFDAVTAGWEMVDQPQLAITIDGNLHVLWSRYALPYGSGSMGLYYARSVDGGRTWTEPEVVTESPNSWGQIKAINEQILHKVWLDTSTGQPEFKHQFSTDGGQSWSNLSSFFSPGDVIGLFDLVSHQEGQLHLIWVIRENKELVLQYRRWNGEAWIEEHSLPIGFESNLSVQTLSAALPTEGSLNVIYSVLVGSKLDGTLQSNLYATSRRLGVPAVPPDNTQPLEPNITATPVLEEASTLMPVSTPTPALTPTAEINLAEFQNAPQGGNEWSGLILGTSLTAITAVIAFGYRMLSARSRRL